MKIHGLQKMTLLDYPGHVACTVFLGGCNLRCPYCHNYELVDGSQPPQMDSDDLLSFLKKRHGLLDGVAITGGEPCLSSGLPDLLKQIRELGFPVKLDTNGTFPQMLNALLDAHLVDYVAMDIKNSPAKYARTSGLEAFDLTPVEESIKLLMDSPVEYEFRTTVVSELHEASDFEAIGRWLSGARHYYLQAFVDRESVPYAGFHAPAREILEMYADLLSHYIGDVKLRGVD